MHYTITRSFVLFSLLLLIIPNAQASKLETDDRSLVPYIKRGFVLPAKGFSIAYYEYLIRARSNEPNITRQYTNEIIASESHNGSMVVSRLGINDYLTVVMPLIVPFGIEVEILHNRSHRLGFMAAHYLVAYKTEFEYQYTFLDSFALRLKHAYFDDMLNLGPGYGEQGNAYMLLHQLNNNIAYGFGKKYLSIQSDWWFYHNTLGIDVDNKTNDATAVSLFANINFTDQLELRVEWDRIKFTHLTSHQLDKFQSSLIYSF